VVADNTYDLASVPRWHSGSMVIIGDAAHAPSSISGQGASLAIEDAVVLAKCVRDAPTTSIAFANYERLRRDRVAAMVRQVTRGISNRVPGRLAYAQLPRLGRMRDRPGRSRRADGPIVRMLRDYALRSVYSCLVTERSLGWTYNHHIDWDDAAEPRPGCLVGRAHG
jgi:2-polyprenyl-6-methoxyphenol hydroxylase-like FAD-dependent oxidoreductase